MIRSYTFPGLASGTTQRVGAFGTHIRCLTGTAVFTLACFKGSELIFYNTAMSIGLGGGPIFARGSFNDLSNQQIQDFDTIEITQGGTTQDIVLIAGDGEVQDNRPIATVTISGTLPVSASFSNTSVQVAGNQYFDSQGNTTLVQATGTVDTIIKAATSGGGDITITNVGAVPCIISQMSTTMTGSTVATAPGGYVLEPVSAGGNAGGSVTLSGGVIVRGYGIGATCRVLWSATKVTP